MDEEPFTPSGSTTPGAQEGSTRPSGTPVKSQSAQTTQPTQAELEKLRETAREQSSQAVEKAKASAQSAAHEAREFGRTFLRSQKDNLAQRADEYADAARAASERLRSEEGNVLAGPAQRAAEGLERMSHYLRDKEPAEMIDDLESLARRRPEVVFGGLFIAGLAAARFLKASRRTPRQRRSADRWGERWEHGTSEPASEPKATTSSEAAPPVPVSSLTGSSNISMP